MSSVERIPTGRPSTSTTTRCRSVLGHQLCGALNRLLGLDGQRGGRRRRAGGLLVEIADARRGREIEVGDDAPERSGVLALVRYDDTVDAVTRHELGDMRERSLPRTGQDTLMHRGRDTDACGRRLDASLGRHSRGLHLGSFLIDFATRASRSNVAVASAIGRISMWRTTSQRLDRAVLGRRT